MICTTFYWGDHPYIQPLRTKISDLIMSFLSQVWALRIRCWSRDGQDEWYRRETTGNPFKFLFLISYNISLWALKSFPHIFYSNKLPVTPFFGANNPWKTGLMYHQKRNPRHHGGFLRAENQDFSGRLCEGLRREAGDDVGTRGEGDGGV